MPYFCKDEMWKIVKNFPKFWYKYKVCTPLSVGSPCSPQEDESSELTKCNKEPRRHKCCFFRHRRTRKLRAPPPVSDSQSLVSLTAKKFDVHTPNNYGPSFNFDGIRLSSTFEALGLGFIVFLGLKHACYQCRRYGEKKDGDKRECPGLANFLFSVVWAVRGSLAPKLTPFYIGSRKAVSANSGSASASEKNEASTENATPSASRIRESLVNLAQHYASRVVNLEGEKCLTKQELSKAIGHFMQASEMGLDIALYNLGVCYEMGVGVRQDKKQAFHYYMEAGKKGNSAALYNIAVCYMDGIGVQADEEESLCYMIKASDKGVKEAQTFMGIHYGKLDDYDKAAAMFQKAVDQKHSDAEYFLGLCYEHGLGVEYNATKAADLFVKAAASGNAEACYKLSTYYEHGIGGLQEDENLAVQLLHKAADAGHQFAIERLKCEKVGIPRKDKSPSKKQDMRSSISSPDLNSLENERTTLSKSPSTTSVFDLSLFQHLLQQFKLSKKELDAAKFYVQNENENFSSDDVSGYEMVNVSNYWPNNWSSETVTNLVKV